MCQNAHIARLQAVGFARETTAGTLSGGTKYRLPKESGIMKPVVEQVDDKSWYGVIEWAYDSQVVRETTAMDLAGIVRDNAIGILLKSTFGSETSTAKTTPNTTVFDHVFTVLQSNNHPSLSCWSYDPVGTFTSTYCMIEELKISASANDYVKFSTKLVGQKMASASTPTVWYASDNAFMARHISLFVADTELWLDSATAMKLNSVEFTVNKNVTQTWIWITPDCFLNQQFVCSGSFEALFINNTDWLALVQGASEKFFRIQIKNTDTTIWSNANPELSFTFSKVVFNTWDKSDANDSIVMQTVGFTSNFNNGSWYSVKAKLTNLQSAVY